MGPPLYITYSSHVQYTTSPPLYITYSSALTYHKERRNVKNSFDDRVTCATAFRPVLNVEYENKINFTGYYRHEPVELLYAGDNKDITGTNAGISHT